jgi:hypothetical protein
LARLTADYRGRATFSGAASDEWIEFRQAWSDYDDLFNAAGHDRTKFDFFLNMPLEEYLTHVLYLNMRAVAMR